MLPEMPARISSSEGDGFSFKSRCARRIMPGVQKPHCRPCIWRKPSCRCESVPSALAMPSMVVMSEPLACTANMVQDFTDMPSISTVQAPQWVVSQPIWVPVSCRFSRMKCTSSVRGSTRPSTSAPLTFMVTWVFAITSSLFRAACGALQRPLHHDAADMFSVFDGPARIGCRRHDGSGCSGGIIADLALQFLVGVAVAGGRHRHRNGGEDFAGLERGEIGALVEVAGRDLAHSRWPFQPVACAKRDHQRRHVVARIAIGDISAD